jgi:hypothetical protein
VEEGVDMKKKYCPHGLKVEKIGNNLNLKELG